VGTARKVPKGLEGAAKRLAVHDVVEAPPVVVARRDLDPEVKPILVDQLGQVRER